VRIASSLAFSTFGFCNHLYIENTRVPTHTALTPYYPRQRMFNGRWPSLAHPISSTSEAWVSIGLDVAIPDVSDIEPFAGVSSAIFNQILRELLCPWTTMKGLAAQDTRSELRSHALLTRNRTA
jgi:hypothetical protein